MWRFEMQLKFALSHARDPSGKCLSRAQCPTPIARDIAQSRLAVMHVNDGATIRSIRWMLGARQRQRQHNHCWPRVNLVRREHERRGHQPQRSGLACVNALL